jgi:hypothetical protein
MSDTDAKRAWVHRVLGVDPGEAPSEPDVVALRGRLQALEASYLGRLRGNPPDRTLLVATMGFAAEQCDAGDARRAGIAVSKLEALLAKPPGDGASAAAPVIVGTEISLYDTLRGPGQLVVYRKILLEWDAARKQAHRQIADLKKKIADTDPRLARSADMLDSIMSRLGDGLADALDAAINADGMGPRASAHVAAGASARSTLMMVSFDPVFRLVDRNPVQPLTIVATLGTALKNLVAALPA